MKLLAITNIYPPQELGGYGRCIHDFVVSLKSFGHQVDVLTSDAPYLNSHSQSISDKLILSDLNISRSLILKGSYERGVSMITCPTTCHSINNINVNIISSCYDASYDGILLGNIDLLGIEILSPLLALGIPILHHIGFIDPPYSSQLQPSSRLYTICPASHAVKDSLLSHGFRVPENSVVYPGVKNEFFFVDDVTHVSPSLSYSSSIHNGSSSLGSATNPIKLGYAGLIMQSKGLHTIIQAANMMNKRGISFQLSVAGSTFQQSYLNKLKSIISANNLTSYIYFLGPLSRSQLSRFWSLQHIGIFPSIYPEAFGIVGAEIMSAGLALISSGVGGACELFTDSASGLRFQPDDSADLFSKVESLVSNPSLLLDIASSARLHVQNSFDVTHSASVLESLFLINHLFVHEDINCYCSLLEPRGWWYSSVTTPEPRSAY